MSLVKVDNLTATGGIDAVTIPTGPIVSVAIHGRTAAVKVYDAAAGTEYFTIPSGTFISIDTHNMAAKILYLQGGAGEVIELLYQIVR